MRHRNVPVAPGVTLPATSTWLPVVVQSVRLEPLEAQLPTW